MARDLHLAEVLGREKIWQKALCAWPGRVYSPSPNPNTYETNTS